MAAALAGAPASFVSADVAVGGDETVVGSFTVDGLTYALDDGEATLVSVASLFAPRSEAEQVPSGAGHEGQGFAEGGFANIAIPESVAFDGVTYNVAAVGPYAFYLSGVTDVALPASIASVDDRAFRSSDVERVEVADGNVAYSSYDGALYSADRTSLLLIPEGRAGAVRIPSHAASVDPSVFSHCAEVDAIAVDAGCPTYSSEDGLLYSADGATLLRVPAGVAEVTIREGCTAIAAGAMEGCANLERIHAPATVTSISPDVFAVVPMIALPAQTALRDEANSGVASALLGQVNDSSNFVPQLTAMVALSATDDDLFEVDSSSITAVLSEGADAIVWEAQGFKTIAADPPVAGSQTASAAYGLSPQFAIIWVRDDCYASFGSTLRGNSERWFPSDNTIIDTEGYRWRGWWRGASDSQHEYLTDGVSGEYMHWHGTSNNSNSYAWLTDDYGNPVKGHLGVTRPSIATWEKKYYSWDEVASSIRDFIFTPDYVLWDDAASLGKPQVLTRSSGGKVTAPVPADDDPTLRFSGWYDAKGTRICGAGETIAFPGRVTLYAHWEPAEYDLGFDVDSEPGDEDYPGEAKPDQTVNVESGQVAIEDPKRPGYVFEGWVIPSTDGTEAVDQELVYEADGKWYVDASKLPDYAGDDGRVELTARWTSVISVDVPQSVTFYADTVTQGQESREGAASSAFGQNKVSNQSQVDLRVVGLESSAVETTDATIGADSILKKAEAATPSTSAGKLLSLYPSDELLDADELQDPNRTSAKPADAVDFGLDDILLEASFPSGSFTIPAGDTLNMGYRLNLAETGQQLDYDKLSTLEDGQSAAIANISYCFAADALPSDWGEPLWIENLDRSLNPAKYLLLDDIKAAADDLSANGTSSKYYDLYRGLLYPDAEFQLLVDGAYLPVQLIGICQDTRSDNGRPAGLTFSFKDAWRLGAMNASDTGAGGWETSQVRALLQGTGSYAGAGLADKVDERLRDAVATVSKRHQLMPSEGRGLQTTSDTFFVPSVYEVCGTNSNAVWNIAETSSSCFQYQGFARWGATYEAVPERVKSYEDSPVYWWTRSACSGNDRGFSGITSTGSYAFMGATPSIGIVPCFCL